MADSIRKYLDLGLAVMPIRDRSKLPVGPWEQHAQERPTKAQWREWWAQYPACNVALVYASSAAPEGKQLVCVDTDTPEAEEWVSRQVPLPITPTAKTAKGRHRYYYAPASLQHSAASEQFPEVRAGVHYTLLPPSIHPDGPGYAWEFGMEYGEVMPAPLPGWGVALMGKPQAAGKPATERPQAEGSAYGLEALRREAEEVESASQGTRNNRLNTAAFCLGQLIAGGQLAEADVAAALRAACERNGWIPQYGDRAFVATLRSGLESGKRQPRAPEPTRRTQSPHQSAPPERVVDEDGVIHDPDTEAAVAAAVNASEPEYAPPAAVVKGFRPAEDFTEQIITATEERRNLPRGVYGLRSGWPTVDRHFGGFRWQQLVFVQAGTGVGKTTLMMHFAFATAEWLMATRSDAVLLVKQLEGGIEQWQYAWAGYKYGVPLWAFHPGGQDNATDEHHEGIMRAYAEWPSLPLEFSEERDGDRMLWDVEKRVEAGPVEAVLLDNIQLLAFEGNQYQGQKRVAGKVMDFCKGTGIPFLALSQVNEHKGQEDSPRGGPEFKHAAGCVLSVKRGDAGANREEALKSNMTRVSNHKLRNAPHGIMPEVRLCMNLPTKRLYEEREYAALFGAREPVDERVTSWPNN